MKTWRQEIIDQEMIDEFIREFRDDIEEAINYILTLEKTPDETDSLCALFRKFHTIKGNADFLGFEKIARLSHEAETLLGNIRDRTVEINSEIIETLLMSTDVLTTLLDEVEGGPSFDEHKLSVLITALSSYLPSDGLSKKVEGEQHAPGAPFASYPQIADMVSQIFDEIVFLAMSGSFNSGLIDIQEKTARLFRSIDGVLYPKAIALLFLFQDCMAIIRDQSLPFSPQNFGLLKNLFLVFADHLMLEIAGVLGIRVVTKADLCRQGGLYPKDECREVGTEARRIPAVIDLSGNEILVGDGRTRGEEAIKIVFQSYQVVAVVDPFEQAHPPTDVPTFASSVEALPQITRVIEKEEGQS